MASSSNTEALSDERLAEITRRWGQHRCGRVVSVYGQAERFREWLDNAAADEHALLDEVHRRQAREAALLALAERVALGPLERTDGVVQCVWCGQRWGQPDFEVQHHPTCPVITARTLLTTSGEGEKVSE